VESIAKDANVQTQRSLYNTACRGTAVNARSRYPRRFALDAEAEKPRHCRCGNRYRKVAIVDWKLHAITAGL
jgi:hypothetical protein